VNFRTAIIKSNHVRWVPYQYGMARTQVAAGEDGFQILGVAVNVLNKLSRTGDRG
jgi:hypothetical protein